MKKLISLLLVFILVIGILPVAAYADGSGSKDFSDGFELLFDGEPWKVFAVEDIEDSLTADDLHITVTDKNGSEVPSDAYTLVIGYETGWDNENDMPFINPCDGPYKITDGEDRESGFLSCGAYAVAKDGSGYTGKTRTNELMIWHKYSFNWFGGAISFGDEFKTNSQWFWHDYYEIPEGSLETPAVYDISGALVDPSLYTLTWYERGTDIPDPADPDYENKLYPRDNPLRGMPETPGSYFACAEAEDPYYGTAWVDFNIYATSIDLSDGCEMRFDGKDWKPYVIYDKNGDISLNDLHITVIDSSGNTVPSRFYDVVVGYSVGWDDKNECPMIDPVEEPFGLPDNEEGRDGIGSYGAYAVAKEGSVCTGRVKTRSFMIHHKYSLNYIGCNATFGEEYKKQSSWSWHDYYEIPEDKMRDPEVYDAENSLVDPGLCKITYFRRVTGVPVSDGEDYLQKVYPEDNPLKFRPEEPGCYFARIDGIDPYYGTGYVDFDITEATGEDGDFASGFKLLFKGEEWGDYYLDGKNDSLSVGDLDITLVKGGKEIVPEDAYELHFFIEKGWDDKTDSPIHEVVEEPFGLSALPEAMDRGWLMHSVYAVAKDGSGYTGQTPEFEFMIKDKYTLDRNSGMIDFGEEYLSRSFRSWHCFYEIPASKMHEPVVTDLLGNELDADNYTLTYFERNDAALNGDNPDRDMLYCEDKPLNGMPAEAGQYFVRLDGKGDYYGVNYADFDIVNSYAQPYGSTARYYDGYTLYMDKDETIKLRFELEPAGSEVMIPGWFSDDLNDAGFRLAFEPETIDGISYAVIDTNGMTEPAEGTLTFNWYKLSEVFDEHGVHWDTAPRYYTTVINIVMQPDVEILGDADGNGEVEVIDATIIQRYIMSFFVPYDTNVIMRGDVDGDDLLTIVDSTLIQRYSTDIKTACRIGSAISEKKA